MYKLYLGYFSVLFAGLVGCEVDKGSEDAVLVPEATVSELIPTVVTVSWTTPEPSLSYVEYGLEGSFDEATPTEEEASLEHAIQVFGLKAGETYTFRVVSETEEGLRYEAETVSVELDPPPAELPLLTVSDYDPTAAAPGGYVLTALIQPYTSWIAIFDRDGDYVWYRKVEDSLSITQVKFEPKHNGLSFMEVDILGLTDQGKIRRFSLDGTEEATTRTVMGHHDYVELPDGTMAWPSYDFRTMEVEGEEMGVVGDMILELEEGGTDEDTPAVAFAIMDQMAVYPPCYHFWEEVFQTGYNDFSHVNSLFYDETRDVFLALARNLDALLVIDASSGEILQHIGGDFADIATEDPADMWSHPHLSHMWDGGFVLFDNGLHHDPSFSRIVEYKLDLDAGALELVWEWSDPEGLLNLIYGDAQKLGDTYLTVWSEFGRIEEVSADGTVVWRVETEIGTAIGRSTWTDDLYDLSDVRSF